MGDPLATMLRAVRSSERFRFSGQCTRKRAFFLEIDGRDFHNTKYGLLEILALLA